MKTVDINEFPADARPYIKEIAERLWSKHAAVMIGSGFSRNAQKNDHTKPDFPTWPGLGDLLYEKLNGKKPGTKETYLNILKIADEVQAAFGRPVLDKLVIDSLPDLDHSPSDVHIGLLNLPWTDIFTTNYDTLLERASQNVYNYKYDLVVNKNELIFAEQPRIVKLHGSMPSERPFIVSEEDYRKYPHDFAPFVNTVQQSLLENTFCLLGFSADDPNFLNWISWINDNLGVNNAPKIYLVGSSNLSDAQRRLLQTRNIIVVKLNEEGQQPAHQELLQKFLDYLQHYRENERPLDWPDKPVHYTENDLPHKTSEILQHWTDLRLSYPNWLIAPLQQRKDLWSVTRNFRLSRSKISEILGPEDIQLLYEYNWRMERCLCPIQDSDLPSYEALLQKYEHQVTENITNRRGGQLEEQWLSIYFNVWRYYREEGFVNRWQACASTMDSFLPFLEGERIASIWYEKCLFHLYALDHQVVTKCISEWPPNPGLPYWEGKRAMLLAETGNASEAALILEQALASVRKRTPRVDNLTDFTWVSQEALLMQLLRYVTRSITAAKDILRLEADSKDFVDRQNNLRLFNCDPWQELETFELMLEHPARDFTEVEDVQEFRIGKKSTTHHLGSTNKDLLSAYQFIRYLEDTGIPPKIGNSTYGDKPLKEAILRIGPSSTSWALGLIMRSGQEKSAKELLTRSFINKVPRAECNRLISYFLDLGYKVLAQPIESKESQRKRHAVPLILSRLLVKSSLKNKRNLIWGEGITFIDDAKALSAIFMIIFFAIKSYEMMVGDKQLEIMPLLRPFSLAMIILWWNVFVKVVAFPCEVVENQSKEKWKGAQTEADNLRVKRAQLMKEMADSLYNFQAQTEVAAKESDTWYDQAWDQVTSTVKKGISTIVTPILELKERLQISIQLLLTQLLELLAVWILRIATYFVFFIQVFYSSILVLLGPFAVAVSILPAFRDSFTTWIARFVSVNLYGAIAYLIMWLSAYIQQYALTVEISRYEGLLHGTETINKMAELTRFAGNGILSFGIVIITFLIGAIAMFTVPSISTWIISTSGISSAASTFGRQTAAATTLVKKTVAGAL
ncbi:SIR2-like domain-containing protein [Mucilaginibacter gossypiicola]|uniref:SIR2-like domain-containing protein n=1 Tax=Mucilaginibacter gossypiicola TaxID=551995 RepID=A0A1H8TL36_9SPHI|nr:SIR2 family protein [Mucilaginibacter gossypiicola]SEO91506.1 SIR2-like domain-containing protein [Mucilaginibacter gossypiicola]